MIADASTDHRTVLKPDQAAIVWSPDEGFSLRLPDYADDVELPVPVVALMALFLHLDDDEFVQSLADEVEIVDADE